MVQLDIHVQKEIFVKDSSNQVYWSDWVNGNGGKLYLLNTDWTVIGNQKCVEIVKGDWSFSCTVKERELLEIAYQKESAVYANDTGVSVIASAELENEYEVYGFGDCTLYVISPRQAKLYFNGEELALSNGLETAVRISLNGKGVLSLRTYS